MTVITQKWPAHEINRPHAEVECHGAVLPVTQKTHNDADSDLDSLGSATVVEINGGPGVACLE